MAEKKATKTTSARPGPRADKADGEAAVLATLAAMPEPDRSLGERLHAIIRATKEGKVEVLDQLSEYGTGITRMGQPAEIEVAGSRMQIQHGDVLRFGERRFVVCLIPAVQAPAGKSAEESHSEREGSVVE